MTTINRLTAATSVSGADQLPVYSAGDGDDRRLSASLLLDYMQDNLVFTGAAGYTQYASPTTGQTVTVDLVTIAGRDDWVVITPAGTLANLTIALTGAGANGQEIRVSTTQILTALAWSGATFQGEPTTLGANGFARLRYDGLNSVWRRVG